MPASIELKTLTKAYKSPQGQDVLVINNVSLSLKNGGMALIDGPSGAGKSTLLNIVSGLIKPDSGEVRIGETPITNLSESQRDRFRAQHIGYIFQSFNLLSPLTILENLTVPMALNGTIGPDTEQKAKAILSRFGLIEHVDKRPYQLSVGQRQRVAVARAILHRPLLLLADEPTASLDVVSSEAVVHAIQELHEQGTTLLIATHDPILKDLTFDAVLTLNGKEVAA